MNLMQSIGNNSHFKLPLNLLLPILLQQSLAPHPILKVTMPPTRQVSSTKRLHLRKFAVFLRTSLSSRRRNKIVPLPADIQDDLKAKFFRQVASLKKKTCRPVARHEEKDEIENICCLAGSQNITEWVEEYGASEYYRALGDDPIIQRIRVDIVGDDLLCGYKCNTEAHTSQKTKGKNNKWLRKFRESLRRLWKSPSSAVDIDPVIANIPQANTNTVHNHRNEDFRRFDTINGKYTEHDKRNIYTNIEHAGVYITRHLLG
ncbi:hypothetical protein K435DRAFT_870954 [Dendrothele bispora CBS 962.96]|uniref:Uncharacterized protein n=1 Tax=Dendrothele bispora (strain CBS 962.96) TaxID=1314807 RepID=A0A4S8L6P3_DENBC|nr:hypothetical protein K435DRAFT_870954 [Dendrothele bispora CBS 962.96]